MSKFAKLQQKLAKIPADLTWDELVTVLHGFGFKEISDTASSARSFVSEGRKIFLHKPHPGNVVKRYALREVVAKLKDFGFEIEEKS